MSDQIHTDAEASPTHPGRRLVITADDFGHDPDTDQLIVQLLAEGAVSATTVLAVSEDLADGAHGLVNGNGPTCGLHFTTSSDPGRTPWRPLTARGAATLADDGRDLPTDPILAEMRATPEVIAGELDAQYRRLTELGLHPDRLDSHAGTLDGAHGNPMLVTALRFCADKGLGMRLPRDPQTPGARHIPAVLRAFHRQAVDAADHLGVPLPQRVLTWDQDRMPAHGEPYTYDLLLAQVSAMLDDLPDGTSELHLHPGADTEGARARFGERWQMRVDQARLLRDPRWHAALSAAGVEVVASW